MVELIQITDILEQKIRKEKELEFYTEELKKLQRKMFFIQKQFSFGFPQPRRQVYLSLES